MCLFLSLLRRAIYWKTHQMCLCWQSQLSSRNGLVAVRIAPDGSVFRCRMISNPARKEAVKVHRALGNWLLPIYTGTRCAWWSLYAARKPLLLVSVLKFGFKRWVLDMHHNSRGRQECVIKLWKSELCSLQCGSSVPTGASLVSTFRGIYSPHLTSFRFGVTDELGLSVL